MGGRVNCKEVRNRLVKKLIKDLEKEYKVNFGVNGNMKVSTYLKRQGIPSLAKALEKLNDNT